MVARLLYRSVSVFFCLGAIVLWLMGISGILLQLTGQGFHLEMFLYSVWAFILAFFLWEARGEAWRAARYHHIRY
jgi:hypothetical protein